jgi:L-rhamnonate dehydratase
MKITDVQAIILKLPVIEEIADGTQDALLVRVYTDEGYIGLGEVDSSPYIAKAVIDAPRSHSIACGLRELLIGEDPLNIDYLWEKMYQGTIYFGRRGVAINAISGIDIALHDIKGQALGVPIYSLLGGAYQDSMRAYASSLMPDTVEECYNHAAELAQQGFSAIKFGWGPLGQDPARDVALVKAMRKGAGEDVDILLDVGFGWKRADHAIEMAQRIAEYRPFWIEEPLYPDDLDGYARLADSTDIRIAAGEEDCTRYAFRDLIERGKVDVVQPDVTRAGGLSEVKKIAAMAQQRGLPCVTHVWSTSIIQAASLHLNVSIPNSLFLEFCVRESPLNKELSTNPFRLEDGRVRVPQEPGLGVKLNQAVLEKYALR